MQLGVPSSPCRPFAYLKWSTCIEDILNLSSALLQLSLPTPLHLVTHDAATKPIVLRPSLTSAHLVPSSNSLLYVLNGTCPSAPRNRNPMQSSLHKFPPPPTIPRSKFPPPPINHNTKPQQSQNPTPPHPILLPTQASKSLTPHTRTSTRTRNSPSSPP